MTTKELLYVEDALSHAQYLIGQLRTAARQLQDPNLKSQIQRMVTEQQKLYTSFYNLV